MKKSNRKNNSSIIRKSINAKIRRDIKFANSFIQEKGMDRFLNTLSADKDRNLFFRRAIFGIWQLKLCCKK